MKTNESLRNFAAALFLFSLLFASGALATQEPDWGTFFITEMKKQSSKLGPQCRFKTETAYRKSIKNKKMDPELDMSSEEFLAYLEKIWIATSFTSMPAEFETPALCFLTQNEYLAIRIYTASYYQNINSALRKLDLEKLNSYRVLIKFLQSGLNKLENYVGVTKRGTSLDPTSVSNCEAGAVFADRGFLSTSIRSGFGGSYNFVLKSKSCKYVEPFSSVPGEEEVLCLPGTIFHVRYFNRKAFGSDVVLEEIGQQMDIDVLIERLEAQPELQNPAPSEFLGQACQPEHLVIEKPPVTGD